MSDAKQNALVGWEESRIATDRIVLTCMYCCIIDCTHLGTLNILMMTYKFLIIWGRPHSTVAINAIKSTIKTLHTYI